MTITLELLLFCCLAAGLVHHTRGHTGRLTGGPAALPGLHFRGLVARAAGVVIGTGGLLVVFGHLAHAQAVDPDPPLPAATAEAIRRSPEDPAVGPEMVSVPAPAQSPAVSDTSNSADEPAPAGLPADSPVAATDAASTSNQSAEPGLPLPQPADASVAAAAATPPRPTENTATGDVETVAAATEPPRISEPRATDAEDEGPAVASVPVMPPAAAPGLAAEPAQSQQTLPAEATAPSPAAEPAPTPEPGSVDESVPAVVPAAPVAETPWTLDLTGSATISSDGTLIALQLAGSTQASSRSLAEILSVVITGRGEANTLTIAGQLGRALTYIGGGGNDRLVLSAADDQIQLTATGAGTVSNGDQENLTFTGVEEVDSGLGSDALSIGESADVDEPAGAPENAGTAEDVANGSVDAPDYDDAPGTADSGSSATVWTVTGPGAGTVLGLEFAGVEKLVGTPDSPDLFAFGPAGSMADGVDGGAGGMDTLSLDGDPNARRPGPPLAYLPDPDLPGSGRLQVGAKDIRYAGLESVGSELLTSEVSVTAASADDALLTADGSTGRVTLQGIKTGRFTFLAPTGALVVNAAGARLRVDDLDLSGATILVTDSAAITVAGRLNAGAITLNATGSADVTDGAVVSSTGGLTIAVRAHQVDDNPAGAPVVHAAEVSSVLHIGAATLRAQDVQLTAETTVSTNVGVDFSGSAAGNTAEFLALSGQSSTAVVVIGTAADIAAINTVTACAVATSLQIVRAESTRSGVAAGGSYATAALDIAAAAKIVAGGEVNLASLVGNIQQVEIAVVRPASAGSASEPAESSAIGDTRSAASTVLAKGALVEGDRVTMQSQTVTDVGRLSMSQHADGMNGIAGANVLSSVDASALTLVDGTVHAGNAVLINAGSTINNGETVADARGTAAHLIGLEIGTVPGLPAFAEPLNALLGTGPYGVAGAAVLVTSRNSAAAIVGADAQVSSRGDLTVAARAEDNLASRSAASVGQPESAGSSGALVAGAADLATHRNEATARVGEGATVNAGGSLMVGAVANVRTQPGQDEQRVAGAEVGRTAFGVTGTAMILDVTNHAQAVVGRGAAATADQRIDVIAVSDAQLASGSDAPATAVQVPVATAGVPVTFGVHGAYQQLSLDASADAHVEDGARLSAVAGVAVSAVERTALLATSMWSGAADVGVGGALMLVVGTTRALGYIEDEASVSTGGDLVIGASNDTVVVATGTLAQNGGPIAIGAGAIVIALDSTTRAFGGNSDGSPAADPTGSTSTIDAAGSVTVLAHSALQLASSGSTVVAPSAVGSANMRDVLALLGALPAPARFPGFGVTGGLSVLFVGTTTEAYLDVPGPVRAGGKLAVDAVTSTQTSTVTTAAANSSIQGVAVSGALTWNEFTGQRFGDPTTADARRLTRASVTAPQVQAAVVSIRATTTDRPTSVTSAASLLAPTVVALSQLSTVVGTSAVGSVAVAGATTLNRQVTTTTAYLGAGTSLISAGDVAIEAHRDFEAHTATLGRSENGAVSVSAALSVDWIDDVVIAAIGDGATVVTDGGLIVRATMRHQVLATTIAESGPSDVLSVAAALGVQMVRFDLRALLGDGVHIAAGQRNVVIVQPLSSLLVVAQATAFGRGTNVAEARTLVSINGVNRADSALPAPPVRIYPVQRFGDPAPVQTDGNRAVFRAAAVEAPPPFRWSPPAALTHAASGTLPVTGVDVDGLIAWALLFLLIGAGASSTRQSGRSSDGQTGGPSNPDAEADPGR